MMLCIAPGYLFLTLSQCICGVLRGVGRTNIPMFVLIGCWCIFRVIWVTVTTNIFHNIVFVNLGWPVSWIFSSLVLGIYYYKANWLYD